MDNLKKAIELHQKHMNDPKTATMESQQKMMDYLKAALDELDKPKTFADARKKAMNRM